MKPSSALPVGVVGLGHFGRFHAQKWTKTAGAQLVALVDFDLARAQALASELGDGILAFDRLDALAGKVSAVSIAVPTAHHFKVARAVIDMGIHVLIEKPLAANLHEADELIAAANQRKLVLAVGHQERFFFRRVPLTGHINGPIHLSARRMGVPSGRDMGCSVILDLMIHDIDLCLSVITAPVIDVSAKGFSLGSGYVEEANVDLRFADGSTAHLYAHRQAAERHRTINIASGDAQIAIDFLSRQAIHNHKGPLALASVAPELEADTLLAETTAFMRAVQAQEPVAVDGRAGRRALEVALMIEQAMVQDPS